MIFNKTRVVYFSPTGTTKRTLCEIAKASSADTAEYVDITLPVGRKQSLTLSNDELLVIGVPVYMGRVPALLGDWLNRIEADNTPAVCVVVYGNRAYENALLELKDTVQSRGCIPVAGAAFVGEHSFSSPETPTAQGRPDENDLSQAAQFGMKIKNKLDTISGLSELPELSVAGSHPYEGVTTLWDVDFIEVSHQCIHCGQCAKVCPQGAVDPKDSSRIDQVKCITCCACIKNCPQNARSMKPGPVMDAAHRLNNLFKERKEPELFV